MGGFSQQCHQGGAPVCSVRVSHPPDSAVVLMAPGGVSAAAGGGGVGINKQAALTPTSSSRGTTSISAQSRSQHSGAAGSTSCAAAGGGGAGGGRSCPRPSSASYYPPPAGEVLPGEKSPSTGSSGGDRDSASAAEGGDEQGPGAPGSEGCYASSRSRSQSPSQNESVVPSNILIDAENGNNSSSSNHHKRGSSSGAEAKSSTSCGSGSTPMRVRRHTHALGMETREYLPGHHRRIHSDGWKAGEYIGTGSFGQVYKAMNTETGEEFAVKELSLRNGSLDLKGIDSLAREIEVMRQLNHPNIVRYLGCDVRREDATLLIFQEWVPGNSLISRLQTYGCFSLAMTRRYTRQLLEGLAYLHANGVIHMDVKCENLLLDKGGVIKLGDFGTSDWITSTATKDGDGAAKFGTPLFTAPEVLLDRQYTTKADIWAVGGAALQMLTLKAPWSELGFRSPVQLMRHMSKRQGPPPVPQAVDRDARAFILRCMEWQPHLRPEASVLRMDPFVQLESTKAPDAPLSSMDSPWNHRESASSGGSTEKGTWEDLKRCILRDLRSHTHSTQQAPAPVVRSMSGTSGGDLSDRSFSTSEYGGGTASAFAGGTRGERTSQGSGSHLNSSRSFYQQKHSSGYLTAKAARRRSKVVSLDKGLKGSAGSVSYSGGADGLDEGGGNSSSFGSPTSSSPALSPSLRFSGLAMGPSASGSSSMNPFGRRRSRLAPSEKRGVDLSSMAEFCGVENPTTTPIVLTEAEESRAERVRSFDDCRKFNRHLSHSHLRRTGSFRNRDASSQTRDKDLTGDVIITPSARPFTSALESDRDRAHSSARDSEDSSCSSSSQNSSSGRDGLERHTSSGSGPRCLGLKLLRHRLRRHSRDVAALAWEREREMSCGHKWERSPRMVRHEKILQSPQPIARAGSNELMMMEDGIPRIQRSASAASAPAGLAAHPLRADGISVTIVATPSHSEDEFGDAEPLPWDILPSLSPPRARRNGFSVPTLMVDADC